MEYTKKPISHTIQVERALIIQGSVGSSSPNSCGSQKDKVAIGTKIDGKIISNNSVVGLLPLIFLANI
ncbi:MAG: hypothetical protein ACJ71D_00280 [Nitrososphaera sp.]